MDTGWKGEKTPKAFFLIPYMKEASYIYKGKEEKKKTRDKDQIKRSY